MSKASFDGGDQIKTVYKGNRHIVILGAGASIASTIHNPEKNNRVLPSMDNLIEVVGLENELKDVCARVNSKNFEKIFSLLFEEDPTSSLLKKIEQKVYSYFSRLELPNTPTIYDYLVLSLRSKDLIATFNWDPFLCQAYGRSLNLTRNLPTLAFLHGNVALGVCEEDKKFGPKNMISPQSQKPFLPVKLLYPITNKNYSEDPFIHSQWDLLEQGLEQPARVTIFGYSAPMSDVEAIRIMENAYGTSEDQFLTQFEIIDIKRKATLKRSWKNFIFSSHSEIHKSFFESTIVQSPRRSGEAFFENYLNVKWYQTNKPPLFTNLDDLWEWYYKFLEYEDKAL